MVPNNPIDPCPYTCYICAAICNQSNCPDDWKPLCRYGVIRFTKTCNVGCPDNRCTARGYRCQKDQYDNGLNIKNTLDIESRYQDYIDAFQVLPMIVDFFKNE